MVRESQVTSCSHDDDDDDDSILTVIFDKLLQFFFLQVGINIPYGKLLFTADYHSLRLFLDEKPFIGGK